MTEHPDAAIRRRTAQEIARIEMEQTKSQPSTDQNVREQIESIADFLGRTHEDMSYGLRSPEDAIRLWRAWRNHPLDAYPDEWENAELISVLGYNPFKEAHKKERETTAPSSPPSERRVALYTQQPDELDPAKHEADYPGYERVPVVVKKIEHGESGSEVELDCVFPPVPDYERVFTHAAFLIDGKMWMWALLVPKIRCRPGERPGVPALNMTAAAAPLFTPFEGGAARAEKEGES